MLLNDAQMYRKILSAIKECKRDKIKMFGSGLPLTERVIKRLQDRRLNVFSIAQDGSRTFLISGYLIEAVKLRDITPSKEEWLAAKEAAAASKDASLIQGPYVITEEVEMSDAD